MNRVISETPLAEVRLSRLQSQATPSLLASSCAALPLLWSLTPVFQFSVQATQPLPLPNAPTRSTALHYDGVPLDATHQIDSPLGFSRKTPTHLNEGTTPKVDALSALKIALFHGFIALDGAAPTLKFAPWRGGHKLVWTLTTRREATESGPAVEGNLWIDARTGRVLAWVPDQIRAQETPRIQVRSARNRRIAIRLKSPRMGPLSACLISDPNNPGTAEKEITAAQCKTVREGKNSVYNSLCQWIDAEHGTPLHLNVSQCEIAHDTAASQRATSDSAVGRAAQTADLAQKYFQIQLGRPAIDSKLPALVAVVGVGENLANAFWDTRRGALLYGQTTHGPDWTEAVDVAGHEWTHALVAATAQLLPMDESGSLNEAIADYFGENIEGWSANRAPNWVFGHQLRLGGLRDLRQMRTYTDKVEVGSEEPCLPENDFCYVHKNATVFGSALAHLQTAIGAESAQRLVYLTLTQALVPSDGFKSAARALLKVCSLTEAPTTCQRTRSVLERAKLVEPAGVPLLLS